MLLPDKVIVVAGIGPGLGRSIAVRSAEQGADVVLAARTASRLDEVAGEVRALGRRALAVPTDITDPVACERLVRKCRFRSGSLPRNRRGGRSQGLTSSVAVGGRT